MQAVALVHVGSAESCRELRKAIACQIEMLEGITFLSANCSGSRCAGKGPFASPSSQRPSPSISSLAGAGAQHPRHSFIRPFPASLVIVRVSNPPVHATLGLSFLVVDTLELHLAAYNCQRDESMHVMRGGLASCNCSKTLSVNRCVGASK